MRQKVLLVQKAKTFFYRGECSSLQLSVSSFSFSLLGVFMGPTNIPFTSQAPAAFQGFPSMGVPVAAAPGLLGNVMGQNTSMMVGMPMPNGFMGNAQTSVMPLPQNVVGPQGGMVGQMGAPQSNFGLPQAQQPQWNLSQVGIVCSPTLTKDIL